MQKIIPLLSLVLLNCTGVATNASAQRFDSRIEVAEQARQYRPDREIREDRAEWEYRGGRDRRLGRAVDQLRREVRQVREQIRLSGGGGRRIRYQFSRVVRATEQIENEFRRGENPSRIRRHIEQTRSELYRVQSELRGRLRGSRDGR